MAALAGVPEFSFDIIIKNREKVNLNLFIAKDLLT